MTPAHACSRWARRQGSLVAPSCVTLAERVVAGVTDRFGSLAEPLLASPAGGTHALRSSSSAARRSIVVCGNIDLGNCGSSRVAFLPTASRARRARRRSPGLDPAIDGTSRGTQRKDYVKAVRPYSPSSARKVMSQVFDNQGGGQVNLGQINVVDSRAMLRDSWRPSGRPDCRKARAGRLSPRRDPAQRLAAQQEPCHIQRPGLMRIFKVGGTKLTLGRREDRHLGQAGLEQRRQDESRAGDTGEGVAGVLLRRQGSQVASA